MNIMIEPLEKSTPSRTRSQLLAVVVIMLLISGCDSLLYVPDCQSASKIDPLSACNIDPLSGTAEVVSVVNRGDPSGFV